MGIKIGDTREIELLDAIKNPSAINFKVGNKYAELTDDITKTNGSPQLKFSKNGNEYYIREIFTIPVNKSIFSKTYTVSEGSGYASFSGSVTITTPFTGRITASGSYDSHEDNSSSYITVSNVGSKTGIRKSGYSFYKDVIDFTGTLNISGRVYRSWTTGGGDDPRTYYYGATLSVNIKLVGDEEA